MTVRVGETHLDEIKNIVIADIVLFLAFSLTIAGGIFQLSVKLLLYYIPIAAVGVTLNFILHELMHKFAAQRYGMVAEFRASTTGLLITIATGAMGFLFGIPGATMIYTQSLTKRQNGIISLVGPATNLVVFGVAVAILFIVNPAIGSYLFNAVQFIVFISLLLGFFNMLPILPLDGSKVLAWNKLVYVGILVPLLAFMIIFKVVELFTIIVMVLIALMFSLFYRRMF